MAQRWFSAHTENASIVTASIVPVAGNLTLCYKHRMPKNAISVTLEVANLTWLKGRAGASGASVSRLLDDLVSAARHGGGVGSVRSVVGSVSIDASDPRLDHADHAIGALFERSLARPLVVREDKPAYKARGPRARKRRG